MEQWIHLSGEITETRAKAEFSGEERWQALLREVKLLDIWVGHLFLTAPFFSFGRQQQGGIGSKGGQRRERVSVDTSAPGEMEGIQGAEVQIFGNYLGKYDVCLDFSPISYTAQIYLCIYGPLYVGLDGEASHVWHNLLFIFPVLSCSLFLFAPVSYFSNHSFFFSYSHFCTASHSPFFFFFPYFFSLMEILTLGHRELVRTSQAFSSQWIWLVKASNVWVETEGLNERRLLWRRGSLDGEVMWGSTWSSWRNYIPAAQYSDIWEKTIEDATFL